MKTQALAGSAGGLGSVGRFRSRAIRSGVGRIDWLDMALLCLFLIGLYTNYTIMVSAKVPFPSAPCGIAGLILLWRRRDLITPRAFVGFIIVLLLFLISVLCATDIRFLPRRTNGLIQLTYSLIIGYALFLTVTHASRRQVAGLFLGFSLVILVGCLLEGHAGLRPLSDAVRNVLYSQGIYENDLRDVMFYKRVRPKFFASEPSSVTFCYTLFTFLWMVVSRWRWKLVAYVGLLGLGLFAMPGPTLLLMLLLMVPYMLFLASRRAGRLDVGRLLLVACIAVVFSGAFVVLVQSLFPARLASVTSGDDPSFFYRVQEPALAGLDVMAHYPLAGAGLSGDPFIETEITNVYLRSAFYSARWQVVTPATELVINYFWLHWIYLGLVWGLLMMAALSVWLRVLGVPSVAFCWMVWAILGQASGAYVGPTCWAVLFLAGAAAVFHQHPQPQRTFEEEQALSTVSNGISNPHASSQNDDSPTQCVGNRALCAGGARHEDQVVVAVVISQAVPDECAVAILESVVALLDDRADEFGRTRHTGQVVVADLERQDWMVLLDGAPQSAQHALLGRLGIDLDEGRHEAMGGEPVVDRDRLDLDAFDARGAVDARRHHAVEA